MLRSRGVGFIFVFSALVWLAAGCETVGQFRSRDFAAIRMDLRKPISVKEREALLQPKALTSVGEMTTVEGLAALPCVGFGLVTGLGENGSEKGGVDPRVRDEIRKVLVTGEGRTPSESSSMINSRDSSIVRVLGAIPAGADSGTLFDAYVQPLDSAISLEGGYLHRTPLRTFVTTETGESVTGDVVAYAMGQVTTAAGGEGALVGSGGSGRAGMIFDGGRYEGERILILRLEDRYVLGSRTVLMEYLLNRRFANVGRAAGTPPVNYASAASNRNVILKVPPVYRRYVARFGDVVKAIKGSYYYGPPPASQMQKLEGLLASGTPQEKYAASVELEAIGTAAVPHLEAAQRKGDDWTTLYAGEGLSYLNSPAGPEMIYRAADSSDEAVRFQAVRFVAQLTGRRAVGALREKLTDASGRIAIEAVKGLLASPDQAATQLRLAGFDLVVVPGSKGGLIVKSSGRPMVVVTGPGTFLTGSVAINADGIGIGSVDASTVAVVAGQGAQAETITIAATTDNLLTLLAKYNPSFETIKKVIVALEDGGNLPYKVTWLD